MIFVKAYSSELMSTQKNLTIGHINTILFENFITENDWQSHRKKAMHFLNIVNSIVL